MALKVFQPAPFSRYWLMFLSIMLLAHAHFVPNEWHAQRAVGLYIYVLCLCLHFHRIALFITSWNTPCDYLPHRGCVHWHSLSTQEARRAKYLVAGYYIKIIYWFFFIVNAWDFGYYILERWDEQYGRDLHCNRKDGETEKQENKLHKP